MAGEVINRMTQKIMEVKNLNVYYGAIHAVKDVNFYIQPGEIVSLIGSNGAGKTSILRAISGLAEARGAVFINGQDVMRLPIYERVTLGVAQSPEGRGVFPNLTVLENLEMGAYRVKNRSAIQKGLAESFELFPRLFERKNQLAGTLSGGEQQMLSISRALMAKPKILLLDEPSLGLAPRIVQQIFDTIEKLNQMGMTLLLVEQNARLALKISHRAYVLETGSITFSGVGSDLLEDDVIRRSYLGV